MTIRPTCSARWCTTPPPGRAACWVCCRNKLRPPLSLRRAPYGERRRPVGDTSRSYGAQRSRQMEDLVTVAAPDGAVAQFDIASTGERYTARDGGLYDVPRRAANLILREGGFRPNVGGAVRRAT